jgi:hypothetical protein
MASDRDRGSRSGLGHVIVGERLDGERFVSGRFLIFDDGENGEDLFEGVVDENKDGEEEDEVGEEYESRPVGELLKLIAKIRLWHVIAPHKQRSSGRQHIESL